MKNRNLTLRKASNDIRFETSKSWAQNVAAIHPNIIFKNTKGKGKLQRAEIQFVFLWMYKIRFAKAARQFRLNYSRDMKCRFNICASRIQFSCIWTLWAFHSPEFIYRQSWCGTDEYQFKEESKLWVTVGHCAASQSSCVVAYSLVYVALTEGGNDLGIQSGNQPRPRFYKI